MKLFFLPLVLFSISGFSQDSLIYFNELEFKSESEKNLYKSAYHDKSSFLFEAFYSVSEDDSLRMATDQNSFLYQIEEIKSLKRDKNTRKYLRKIYEEMHSRFLRKYEELVNFDQIFDNGVYNCVTACAIYAMAFEQLGIPYTIKETPTHVYIVAFPGGDQFLIETTNPVGGFKSFSDVFKRSYVALLEEQKIVDASELSTGIDKVFNKYYYSKDEVNLKQLLGIQYYNMGIKFFRENEYQRALEDFQKAFLLYNSDQIRNMVFASLSSIVSGSNYSEQFEVESLGKISRFEMYDIKSSEILGEFGRLTQQQLISKNDTSMYAESYNTVIEKLHTSDSILGLDISYVYFYERARILYNRALYDEAMPLALAAFQTKPKNADSETLLLSCFTSLYNDDDTKLALDKFEKLMDENSTLKNNYRFGAILLNLYLVNMREDFIRRRYTSGFIMKKQFENLQKENPKYRFDEAIAGNAYSQVVAYYFRKGQLTNARNILNIGFKYAPHHAELKTRQYMLNR